MGTVISMTEKYCKHLKWLSQFEGEGDYRCELGNKTSSDWCFEKERCNDYELADPCNDRSCDECEIGGCAESAVKGVVQK